MKVAVYPGSFDPITNGHIDILEKTSKIFDKIIIAVIHNVTKQALFTLEERVNLIEESIKHLPHVEVDYFSGLLANYLPGKQACAIIRGLRTVTDFDYEMHMAMMNKKLIPDIDTIFVMSDSNYTFISSSAVKEAALLGGDVSSLVPEIVKRGLEKKIMQLQYENS
ncbi:MAG: pantetheine-phosphate adenylyltransferase [Syntrophomonadaceae bacterium]|nr:pantetheine-phosphate adenylyltransferase [Syntrophomonadaceae bacterium]MDD3023955.1 pantetheine-phosphate adenylyltransferase [Syntrophomonadaceae bacterium]